MMRSDVAPLVFRLTVGLRAERRSNRSRQTEQLLEGEPRQVEQRGGGVRELLQAFGSAQQQPLPSAWPPPQA